jgi:hypothetical protein
MNDVKQFRSEAAQFSGAAAFDPPQDGVMLAWLGREPSSHQVVPVD